jgi:hypothetical protein
MPNEHWLLKSRIHCNETQVDLQEGRIMSEKAGDYYYPNHRYWNNYFFVTHEPTFTCGFERKIGSRADGGKWICDPHRIPKEGCLIYSIGSNNQFDFEEAMHEKLRCETHTFDPTVDGKNALQHVTTFHRLGLISKGKADNILFYSIGHLADSLNHANRTIDIFKIDCEGCEYELFDQDFFSSLKIRNIKIRQILIELHPVNMKTYKQGIASEDELKLVNNFFKLFRDNGYVIFHKEPNNLSGNVGRFVEYSFLLIEGLKCSQ